MYTLWALLGSLVTALVVHTTALLAQDPQRKRGGAKSLQGYVQTCPNAAGAPGAPWGQMLQVSGSLPALPVGLDPFRWLKDNR